MKHYQVIVAGAGPAGSSAARVLAGAGLSVLVLDRAVFPRPKLCAGLLTHKAAFILEQAFGLSADQLLAQGAFNHASTGYACYHKTSLLAKGQHTRPFYFAYRDVFDHFLLQQAEAAGAEVITGLAVTDVVQDNDQILVQAGGESISADYLVAADGVNSLVRRRLFRQKGDQETYGLAATLEMFLPRSELNWPEDFPSIYLATVPQGYSWIFPHKDKIALGLGGPVELVSDLPERFRQFLQAVGLAAFADHPAHGHLLPYGNYKMSPVRGRVLLAGDAGGFADPLLGEGLYYALRTGTGAARAILRDLDQPGSLAADYLGLLERDVFPEMVHAARLRRFVHSPLGPTVFRLLMPLLRRPVLETIHGDRSYRHLKKRANMF